jgi:hypothetical protein
MGIIFSIYGFNNGRLPAEVNPSLQGNPRYFGNLSVLWHGAKMAILASEGG